MKNVKITVLRKQLYEDFAEEHLTDGIQPCDFYEEGDTFLYTGGAEMPEGFCPWAWIDLYRAISAYSLGAKNDWYKPGVSIECCTDGVRPVIYELALLDEDVSL